MADPVVEAAPTTEDLPIVPVPPVVTPAEIATLYLWICGYQALIEEERCTETRPACSNCTERANTNESTNNAT
jgi:hypothetical protein